MGWNSWNVWAGEVDADKVKAAADEMISTGLAAPRLPVHQHRRHLGGRARRRGPDPDQREVPGHEGAGRLRPRQGPEVRHLLVARPQDLRRLHGVSYQHEDQDAQSYADWGVDYLKYDWCSYGGVAARHGPGGLAEALRRDARRAGQSRTATSCTRLCQYGMGDVWKWGQQIGGNCWRTTGDINDSWGSLHGIYESQAGHEMYAGPGHWNDPDMLVVGNVGFGNPHPTHLKPNEQILHISMWCLLSAPLLIGCDMTRLDPFTLALLSNDEVLDINQDPLGKPGRRAWPRTATPRSGRAPSSTAPRPSA